MQARDLPGIATRAAASGPTSSERTACGSPATSTIEVYGAIDPLRRTGPASRRRWGVSVGLVGRTDDAHASAVAVSSLAMRTGSLRITSLTREPAGCA